MTPEERAHGWTRVNYIMELVKNEGDAECEAALDFLLAERRLSIAEEREACARLSEEREWESNAAECSGECGDDIARAIRARVTPSNLGRAPADAAAGDPLGVSGP